MRYEVIFASYAEELRLTLGLSTLRSRARRAAEDRSGRRLPPRLPPARSPTATTNASTASSEPDRMAPRSCPARTPTWVSTERTSTRSRHRPAKTAASAARPCTTSARTAATVAMGHSRRRISAINARTRSRRPVGPCATAERLAIEQQHQPGSLESSGGRVASQSSIRWAAHSRVSIGTGPCSRSSSASHSSTAARRRSLSRYAASAASTAADTLRPPTRPRSSASRPASRVRVTFSFGIRMMVPSYRPDANARPDGRAARRR